MAVIARRINAIPARSALDAWQLIVDLVAPSESFARAELKSIEGIGASIITDEAPKDSPIVFHGSGARVRFFCLYGEDAIAGDQANEAKLPHCPTDHEWRVSIPCVSEDLAWVNEALAKKSHRITARVVGSDVVDSASSENVASDTTTIDTEAFYRL